MYRQVTRSATPARSATAARAHAAGDVSWTIDLAQPATVGVQRSVEASRNYALVGMSFLTAALWIYDVATLLSHTN